MQIETIKTSLGLYNTVRLTNFWIPNDVPAGENDLIIPISKRPRHSVIKHILEMADCNEDKDLDRITVIAEISFTIGSPKVLS